MGYRLTGLANKCQGDTVKRDDVVEQPVSGDDRTPDDSVRRCEVSAGRCDVLCQVACQAMMA